MPCRPCILPRPRPPLSAATSVSRGSLATQRGGPPAPALARQRRRRHQRQALPTVAATTATSSSDDTTNGTGGMGSRFSTLANALTNLFPIWVLGAAVWALKQPAAFTWFGSSAITPALAVTMLGMGLTLTFEVTLTAVAVAVLPQPGVLVCPSLHAVLYLSSGEGLAQGAHRRAEPGPRSPAPAVLPRCTASIQQERPSLLSRPSAPCSPAWLFSTYFFDCPGPPAGLPPSALSARPHFCWLRTPVYR